MVVSISGGIAQTQEQMPMPFTSPVILDRIRSVESRATLGLL